MGHHFAGRISEELNISQKGIFDASKLGIWEEHFEGWMVNGENLRGGTKRGEILSI